MTDAPRTLPWPGPSDGPALGGRITTAVLCAAFDSGADNAVLAIRDRLIRARIGLPARPRHRPHLTLAAVRVHRDQLPVIVEATAAMATEHHSIPLPLTRIGTFTRAGALWLGPSETHGPTALRALQQSAVALIAGSGWPEAFAGRSRIDEWVPHCSLATRLPADRLGELQQVVGAGYEPIAATVLGIVVIAVGGAGDVGPVAPLTS